MNNKILLLVVLILVPVVVISFNKNETNFNLPENKSLTVKLKDSDGKIIKLDLEEYIVGVVAAEMPASFNVEALKAQAVAARSYALYHMNNDNNSYDLEIGINDQSYITKSEMQEKWGNDFDNYYTKVVTAVTETKDEIITYNEKVIQAFYFAMSNGYTEDSALVFKEEPYLESVESSWDNETIKNFLYEKTLTKEDFCSTLKIGCEVISIKNINRSKSNRVNSITINNKTFVGTEVRKLLGLRSTDFNIKVGDFVTITTYGYGHGVGMSQYGANGMASSGYNYKEILSHYYTNTKISNYEV